MRSMLCPQTESKLQGCKKSDEVSPESAPVQNKTSTW